MDLFSLMGSSSYDIQELPIENDGFSLFNLEECNHSAKSTI